MSIKAVASFFLLLFFTVISVACLTLCGYFFDGAGHNNIAIALGWTGGLLGVGVIASAVNFFAALWE